MLRAQEPGEIDRVLSTYGESEPRELGRRLADLGPGSSTSCSRGSPRVSSLDPKRASCARSSSNPGPRCANTSSPWLLSEPIPNCDARPCACSKSWATQAAARAAVAFEDAGSALDLIRLLDHEFPGVRSAALDGLEAMSGQSFGRDADRWLRWHEGEVHWWNERFGPLADAMQNGARHEVTDAIGQFSKRRFFRHELAGPLSSVLAQDEADLVQMSCAALCRPGPPWATSAPSGPCPPWNPCSDTPIDALPRPPSGLCAPSQARSSRMRLELGPAKAPPHKHVKIGRRTGRSALSPHEKSPPQA